MVANQLIEFIDRCPNSYYVVKELKETLNKEGFEALDLKKKWNLQKGKSYFLPLYDTSLIAFKISNTGLEDYGYKMVTAHTDSPAIKIKPNPEITTENYLKLNTEIYGGPILSTWFDRPLAVAGKVTLRSENPLVPRFQLINIEEPLMIIPNLAIHMNRKVNEGVEINRQIDMEPVVTLIEDAFEKDNHLKNLLAKECKVSLEEVMDFDLYLYPLEKGTLVGQEKELISVARLDDLSMVYTGLKGLLETTPSTGISMLVALDNEEIGSRSKQGADSPALNMVLEKIALGLGHSREDYLSLLFNSFMISADVAHAIHPNRPEKHDPILRPHMNKGPVIKYNSNYKYASESTDAAVFESICQNLDIPVQKYANRSDQAGGSTIGAVNAGQLPVRTIDIGAAMLAMHSARELMGAKDIAYFVEAFKGFFTL